MRGCCMEVVRGHATRADLPGASQKVALASSGLAAGRLYIVMWWAALQFSQLIALIRSGPTMVEDDS